jgi:outer membrane cobalamin receptor
MKQVLVFIFILLINSIYAQDTINDPYEMNLYELSKTKVVTVSKTPQEMNLLPANVKIITKQEIAERGYFTFEEILSDLSGFQFRNILGLNSYVFQRGIPNQNNLMLVLVDGIQINELNSGGFYGGGQFNLTNIERIEIVYGPASALYGTNAVSGVVNIITKDTYENQGFFLDVLAGNFKTFNSNAGYNFYSEEKKLGINFSVMYKTSEKADLKGTEGDNNWTENMENFENDYAVDFKINYKNIICGFNYQNKQTSVTTYYPSVGSIYQDFGTLWNIMFLNSYLKYNYIINRRLTINNTLYYRNSTVLDNSIREIVDTAQFGYYRPNFSFGNDIFINYEVTDNIKISGGILFDLEQLAEDYSITQSNSSQIPPPVPSRPDMENNYLLSTYLQSQINFLKYFYLFSGLRYDNSSVYNQVVTPRIALLLNYQEFNLKLIYLNAFRAPKPWDYTNGLGNNLLIPEKMNSIELIAGFYLTQNLLFSTDFYRNNLNGAFTKEYLFDSYRWINKGEIITDGIEVNLNFRNKLLNTNLNYTYNNSIDEFKIEIPEIAKHTANANFSFNFLKYFNANLRINYLGKRKNPKIINSTNSEIVDDALILNCGFSILDYKNTDIQIFVKNILNTEYYHTSNQLPDRYRQPQRTIMIKIGFKIKK